MTDRMITVIDRLFRRLAATYGDAWDRQIGTAPIADVKTVWMAELGMFGGSLQRIAWALDNLPARAPNAIEFKLLCRQAPMPEMPALPAPPPADPARVKEALGKLREPPPTGYDHKAWAKAILANARGGMKVNPTALQMARAAVRAEA